jgi:hypothetical protein
MMSVIALLPLERAVVEIEGAPAHALTVELPNEQRDALGLRKNRCFFCAAIVSGIAYFLVDCTHGFATSERSFSVLKLIAAQA